MKYYCNSCHRLFQDEQTCPFCKKQTLTEKLDIHKPVTVVSAYGIERDRITAALEDSDIPYATRAERKESSAKAVTGLDNAKYRIEVPYSYYNKAMEVLVGINAVNPEEYPDSEIEVDSNDSSAEDEFEDMPPAKRNAVRIISALLFILVVALVIFGVDFITGMIKGLFA